MLCNCKSNITIPNDHNQIWEISFYYVKLCKFLIKPMTMKNANRYDNDKI